ncbi:hypothetical protein JXA70_10580 [candidate division KSB1 bacterium]|nr:hypothetical protein [candidate division KSB1 bacterium]
MMQSIRRQQSRAGRLLMTIVIASLVAFSFFIYYFAHLHVLSNGRILVHSHALPKGQENGNSHTHSSLELLVLDQSNIFNALFPTIALFLLAIVVLYLPLLRAYVVQQAAYCLFSRRGPPPL